MTEQNNTPGNPEDIRPPRTDPAPRSDLEFLNGETMKKSVLLRFLCIFILTLFLMVPSGLVQSLVIERESRRNSAIAEVSQKWGVQQSVFGPVLYVPLKNRGEGEKSGQGYLHCLPDSLEVSAEMVPEIRYRGIFRIILYNIQINAKGEFRPLDLENLGLKPADLSWHDAFFSLGIQDPRGIKDHVKFVCNASESQTFPGVRAQDIMARGITVRAANFNFSEINSFSFVLKLNGSEEFKVVPVAKETRVSLSANWKDPSFVGDFLPEKREIGPEKFSAEWKILDFNRDYPQAWIKGKYEFDKSAFGVRLIFPVDEYQKTTRSIKYDIMFITLTFLAFLMIEILTNVILHPVQYVLMGLALVLFYLLLLSFSEYLPFHLAYLIASFGTILLIAMYSWSITSRSRNGLIIGGVLTGLYGFLYVILQMQDYALLGGSVGLFIILALVMYLTRHVDWYSVGEVKNSG